MTSSGASLAPPALAPRAARRLPAACGIGLRAPHVEAILASRPPLAWVEAHPENYLGGGPAFARLLAVRRDYPVSLHGVGLSLGTDGPLDARHLGRLAALAERVEPVLVSEHLAWSIAGGAYLNDLLPLPCTEEALAVVAEHVDQVQEVLGRRILVENPSSYFRFRGDAMTEPELLSALVARTGCGLLCDVNNAFVTAHNLGLDPVVYLDAIPADAVEEIHLAGHAVNDADGRAILIDDHGSRVAEPVWALYAHALARFGPVPTLIEWDTDIPTLEVLIAEAAAADRILTGAMAAPERDGRAR